jgi:predicted transglutaminase-like cysteine proteinase
MKNLLARIIWAHCWVAALLVSSESAFAGKSVSSHMITLGLTSQPIGHYEYCKSFASDCAIHSVLLSPVKLSHRLWRQMVEINAHSNTTVTPVTDLEYYKRQELWTYPERFGDCEDYVLLKRKLLMEAGWPPSSLLITVVTLPNGEGHAILTVRTDRADYALDNLSKKILPWNKTKYRFLKRQSASHSGQWVGIDDPRGRFVGSVR